MDKNYNNNFYLDIFNNILDFNESEVIIIFDIDGNIWFCLADILKMLNYTSIDKTIQKININGLYKIKYKDLNLDHPSRDGLTLKHNKFFINESGLYEVLTKSTKPIAKIFIDKYFTEIMPQIRKTGKYISNKNDMNEIKKLNNKIDNYKTELTYYNDKYKFEPSEHGYLYINQDNQIKNGKHVKCYIVILQHFCTKTLVQKCCKITT